VDCAYRVCRRGDNELEKKGDEDPAGARCQLGVRQGESIERERDDEENSHHRETNKPCVLEGKVGG